jgi:hypothetical protein
MRSLRAQSAPFSSKGQPAHNFHAFGQSKKKLPLGPKMKVISGIA